LIGEITLEFNKLNRQERDMTVAIHPIPAFRDNYIWAFSNDDTNVYVVDPGDAEPVRAFLKERGLNLAGILVTHHHPDHTGGILSLTADHAIPVYGPGGGRIEGITQKLGEGDTLTVAGLKFLVIAVPGHTLDHIAYYCQPQDASGILFCGDTLFAAGCGRLFEGTPEMMYASLQKLASLPDTTEVYCTHEYTMSNLAFAAAAEPENSDIRMRQETARRRREHGQPTLPSTILLELRTNPFLRCHNESLQSIVARHCSRVLESDIDTFAALRSWKDNF
jgi:hydroxyacylglutathione hydrolase